MNELCHRCNRDDDTKEVVITSEDIVRVTKLCEPCRDFLLIYFTKKGSN